MVTENNDLSQLKTSARSHQDRMRVSQLPASCSCHCGVLGHESPNTTPLKDPLAVSQALWAKRLSSSL